MTPYITAHHGSQDGIRWGNILFEPDLARRWQEDLLTGALHLYESPATGYGRAKFTEDTDPARLRQTREALAEYRRL